MISKNQLLTTIAWKIGDTVEYALEGSMLMAGAVVQWLRDELQMIRTSAEVEELAASVPSSNGVVLVPAFAGLGAPHWDQYARGALLGMTRGTTRAHIARAALEGIALQVMDVLEAMQTDSGLPLAQLRVDGGASANNLLMQIQADVLGIDVVRPKNAEATVLGAAYLAGLAVGYWPDKETIARQWQVDRVFKPQIDAEARRKVRATWHRALDRARDWARRGDAGLSERAEVLRTAGRTERAVGCARDWRRSQRAGRGRGGRFARLPDGAGGAIRFRQGDFEPQHEAGAWRRAVSRAD